MRSKKHRDKNSKNKCKTRRMLKRNGVDRKGSLFSAIIRFTYAVLVSAIFVALLSPGVCLFLFFIDLIWLMFLLCYGNIKNRYFLTSGVIATGGCAIAFLAVKIFTGHQIRIMTNMEGILFIVGIAELAIAAAMCAFPAKVKQEKQELYDERKYDLERIKGYIQKHEIVGVNAIWGAGKSFVVDYMKQDAEIRKQFEMIQVDLLSCDLDAVELTLVEELEKVFQRRRIYPEGSRRLKNLLGKNQWSDLLGGVVIGNPMGLSASFDSFRQELGKLDRKVLIIFEDIDRIFEKDTIQKIFAISEKLSCDSLHVLFEYDMHELEEKGFDRNYLEKYIPYNVNLTPIPFRKLVGYLWDELKMNEVPLKQEDVYMIGWNLSGRFEAERILGMDMALSMDIEDGVSPRKVRFFLEELREMLLTNDEFRRNQNAKTVMHAVFIKHFFSSYYNKIRVGESPLQVWKLLWENKEFAVPEIMDIFRKRKGKDSSEREEEKRLQNLHVLMENEGNRNVLSLIFLLGYELQIDSIGRNWDEIVTESESNLNKKERNEKIDRIIWNVLANGTSELTNAENAVQKLQEVLARGGEAQEHAWKEYREDMFNGKLWKDNSTIFRIGGDPFLALFQSMKIVGAKEEEWKHFLEFYFSQYRKEMKYKAISVSLIDNLNYCDPTSRRILLQVIRFMNGLEIIGNLNEEKSYKLFWERYLGAVAMLGYTERIESWMFSLSGNIMQNRQEAESLMEELLEELRRRQEDWKLDYVRAEYSDIIQFVEKNQLLIQCKTEASKRGPFFKTEMRSRWTHQEEMDRLKEIWEEGRQEQFNLELEESYREEKLHLSELNKILQDCNERNDFTKA